MKGADTLDDCIREILKVKNLVPFDPAKVVGVVVSEDKGNAPAQVYLREKERDSFASYCRARRFGESSPADGDATQREEHPELSALYEFLSQHHQSRGALHDFNDIGFRITVPQVLSREILLPLAQEPEKYASRIGIQKMTVNNSQYIILTYGRTR